MAAGASEVYSLTVLHTDKAMEQYKHMKTRLKPDVDFDVQYASPKKLEQDRKFMLSVCCDAALSTVCFIQIMSSLSFMHT